MSNSKFVRKTPYGDIVVTPTGTECDYPGIVIEFDGDVVARVEYNEYDEGLAVMSWYKGNEDYSNKLVSKVKKDSILHKVKSDESLSKLEDIYHAIKTIEESDGVKITLNDSQLLTLIGKAKRYDYSSYNEYVSDLVREEVYDGKKW